jgi:ATP-dependent helicase Lhr and Lhr-like helicase
LNSKKKGPQDKIEDWFKSMNWKPAKFQKETWQAYAQKNAGMINAPTGSGKTYSIMLPCIADGQENDKGVQMIWITPIKALSKEIFLAAERAIIGLHSKWRVALRTGDTTTSERKKILTNPPQILITTPESIHVMMASKGYADFFKSLKCIVVDEWHELMGSKRGVQVELAMSRFRGLNNHLKVWGISATIGNMEGASDVLHGIFNQDVLFVKSNAEKKIEVKTLLPEDIEKFPWAGHLGLTMVKKVIPIILNSKTTLIFTNTRAQCEIWYQKLLDAHDDFAGVMAMHHGSISKELRDWVEESLHEGKLKLVVCTSSLDLGVDFRPVETIIQIGSPKSISRFMQRAGRSGHQPGATSKIFFVPTNSLELIEAAALRSSIKKNKIEKRIPYYRSFDVLIQYLMTLAVSEGFNGNKILQEIRTTFSFADITDDEWNKVLNFLLFGGKSLGAYDEYRKLEIVDGIYKVESKAIAYRHRMSIGTIVSDAMMQIRYVKGTYLGTVEEYFISNLEEGDTFWFAGRSLELIRIKDMTVQVKDSKKKNGKIPSYMGGRLAFSSQMSDELRSKMNDYLNNEIVDVEVKALIPLFETQKGRSCLPRIDEFLIEYYQSDEGYHLMIYPFEGRNVHEGLASLIGKRLSRILPISFSIAYNDYGFELLSDKKIDVDLLINKSLFSDENLMTDIQASMNAIELAKRNFRDIAKISGLIFQGYPGKPKKDRHLQSSSQLLFGVFREYEPDNLLYLQTYEEIRIFQFEEERMRSAISRIQELNFKIIHLKKPSPFSFPLMVDRLREKMTSEKIEDRIAKMLLI